MTAHDLEVARLALQAVSTLAAVVSLYAILRGLRQMEHATTERARREDAKHAEAMEALRQQGETLSQQGESLRQQGETLRAVSKSLEAAVRGMETVIERTAPGRTGTSADVT